MFSLRKSFCPNLNCALFNQRNRINYFPQVEIESTPIKLCTHCITVALIAYLQFKIMAAIKEHYLLHYKLVGLYTNIQLRGRLLVQTHLHLFSKWPLTRSSFVKHLLTCLLQYRNVSFSNNYIYLRVNRSTAGYSVKLLIYT